MGKDAHCSRSREMWRSAGPPIAGRQSILHQADSLLLKAVDAGLVAIIFAVPLALGGRIALGQLALVALALWVSICWCIRQSLSPQAAWTRTWTEPLLLAALALVGLQLVALPPTALNRLSPQLFETLTLWSQAGQPGGETAGTLGVWPTISLTPAATRDALILLLAFMLLFLTTVQRVQRVEDVERLIRWLAWATLSMAILGVAQYFTNTEKYFWFYEHPDFAKKQLQGSFTNRNHFGHFIALGIGPLTWWLWQALRGRSHDDAPRTRRSPQHNFQEQSSPLDAKVGMRILGLAFCVFAVLLSLSRGGAAATGLAGVVCLLILYRASLIDRKILLGLAGFGLLLGACLCIYGYDAIVARLDDFKSIEDLDSGGRLRLWRANIEGIADYPLTGTGLGSHREVYPMYLKTENHHRIEYTHAENGYLQIGLEAGLPGLLLALIAVGFCVFWCRALLRRITSTRVLLCVAAIAPAFAASFAHSTVDFVWYVPGCMVPMVVLAACACRLWQVTRQREGMAVSRVFLSRTGWIAMSLCLAVVGTFMLDNKIKAARAEPAWNRCVRLNDTLPDFGKSNPPETLRSMREDLATVVAYQPDNARAHTWLAAVNIKLFDVPEDANVSPIDVRQVRETVLLSNFESSQAMRDWLSRAFGRRSEHLDAALYHARRALSLCPLQGEAYLDLADVSFLEGLAGPDKVELVKQALKVRPFDGTTLFAAGQEAALAGDPNAAIAYWQASYKLGSHHQHRLLRSLTREWPANILLEIFPSDVQSLPIVIQYYKETGREEDVKIAREQFALAAANRAGTEQGALAAEYWMRAGDAYLWLAKLERASQCLHSAVRSDPSSIHAHRMLGALLIRLEEFEEAEKHVSWCLQRDPNNKYFRTLLDQAVDGQLRPRATSAQRGSRPVVN